jgi:uncharacterized protein
MRRAPVARLSLVLALVLLAAGAAGAAPEFPELTGRVVDGAGLLSPEAERRIAERLEAHERATGNQVVVVTLDSLQGYPIEDFGYQLGRHWGIGQKGTDNGAILIVAPGERKVRIEVGYGLEGELTDAMSSHIIQDVILPRFRRGDFEGGVEAGAAAMVEVLGGEYTLPPPQSRGGRNELGWLQVLFILLGFGLFIGVALLQNTVGGRRFARRRGIYVGGGGFGGGGGGFGGGGFGGGGGGFGGGGASGSW